MAGCIVALTVGTTGIFSRAESVTAQENLEKLKNTNSCRGCDLSGLTLNRLDLAGADLEGADFSMTKFYLSNLSGANLRNANLKGASFGGTDLGEADLRGADLRGTSLEGAYLEQTLLDGEFITAKPYEEIGVTDVEKQVYVPNPEKPKKSPETRDVKVAPRRDSEEKPSQIAVEQGAKSSSGKKAGVATADKFATKADEYQPAAPAAKKAVPVRQAIVEPQEQAGPSVEQAEASKAAITKSEKVESGVGTSRPDKSPKQMAKTGKPSPVPPAEVKMDDVQAVTTHAKTM